MTFGLSYKPGGCGGGLISGCAACQGMVFGPFVLNRVIYPKLKPKMKGVILNRVGVFGLFLVLNRVRVSNPQRQPYTQTWVECHQKL